LVALLGAARTKDIIFTARLIEAPDALALGLLSEVVPDADALQRCAACARTSSAMKAKT
jgi:enoyl-CoA hydratase/carnithine racemase